MLEINSKNSRFLARLGARGVLGQAVYDYLCDQNELFVISADLSRASGFERVKKNFPDQFINVGIAEQNMIGIAAGLASKGTPVIATTWSTFASARVADQVRNFMGFMQSNIKLVGMDSGFAASSFGYTHSNAPDIAMIRSIPGIKILSPCDGVEIYKAINEAFTHDGPFYIRLTDKQMLPMIYTDDRFDFSIGKANVIKEGNEIAIVSCGTIMQNVIEAAKIVESESYSVKIVDMHTIVPLDKDILKSLLRYKAIVIVEDHIIPGGLYSAICECLCQTLEGRLPKMIPIAPKEAYLPAGTQKWTEEYCGLDAVGIANRILSAMKED